MFLVVLKRCNVLKQFGSHFKSSADRKFLGSSENCIMRIDILSFSVIESELSQQLGKILTYFLFTNLNIDMNKFLWHNIVSNMLLKVLSKYKVKRFEIC